MTKMLKRTARKTISLITIVSICLLTISVDNFTVQASEIEYSTWDGKTITTVEPIGNTYTINTPSELAWFRSVVQAGSVDFSNYVIEITGNHDFNNKPWTSISVKNGYLLCQKLFIHDCQIKNLTRNLFENIKIDELYVINTNFIDLNMYGAGGSLGVVAGNLEINDYGNFYIYNVSINGKIWGDEYHWGYRGSYGALMNSLTVDSGANVNIMYLDVDIQSRGGGQVGGLIAQTKKKGTGGKINISRTSVRGSYYAKDTYGYSEVYCGGMIGEVIGNEIIVEECIVKGSFETKGYTTWCGGLIAKADADILVVNNCQFDINVSSHCPGGILGQSSMGDNGESIIKNCFVVGSFNARQSQAFVSLNAGDGIPVKNCYFDYEKSNLSKNNMYGNGSLGVFWSVTPSTNKLSGCRGLTTDESQRPSSFENWDFNAIWNIGETSPVLVWKQMGLEPPKWANRLLERDSDLDAEMIEKVKRYTSAANVDVWDYIMKSPDSDQEKFRKLSQLSSNMGLSNPEEGIKYLQDTSSERWAYKFLTTNEAYCAYDFGEYINSNLVARSALYSGGLIFNTEWKSYIDFTTYVNGSYPDVEKCKKVLIDFMTMNDSNLLTDSLAESKKIARILKNTLKLNSVIGDFKDDYKVDSAMNKVLNATSAGERESAQEEFAQLIFDNIKSNQTAMNQDDITIYIDANSISKALGYSSTILGFAASSAKDISAMLSMEESIETYLQYKDFLTTIYNCEDVSIDMRMAAWTLLDDIDNGYYNKTISIISNVVRAGVDIIYVDKSLLRTYTENVLGIPKTLGGALDTLTLATYISNDIINTGDYVKNAAYTCSYAELSCVYYLKLLDDEQAFLQEQSAENAWKFYEDYNILWRLRYCGEEQYSKLASIKAFVFADVKTKDYKLYEEVVGNNLSRLKECRFSIASNINVPASIQYASKIVIDCPVNVEVYKENGDLLLTLVDGELSDVTNKYGRFSVVYEPYTEEYAKVICLNDEEGINLRVLAVDSGFVTYRKNTISSLQTECFDNLKVDKGDLINISDDRVKLISENGGVSDVDVICKDFNTYVPVTDILIGNQEIEIEPSEKICIDFAVAPLEASNQSVSWYSYDDSIAKVKNGVIEGVKEGKTKILLSACDGTGVNKELNVIVKKGSIARPTGLRTNNAGITGGYVRGEDTSQVDDTDDVDREHTDDVQPIYRLYNLNTGEHFYTAGCGEYLELQRVGWEDEGIGWNAPRSGEAVYRMYNSNAGDHHYTTNWAEVVMLQDLGWNYEGIAWYSDGDVKIYRAYNPNALTGAHYYTFNQVEFSNIISIGWRDEGIGWYGM